MKAKITFAFIAFVGLIVSQNLWAQGSEPAYQEARKKYYELISSQQTGQETEWMICVEMFRKVSEKYPDSKRAPDALFTQGLLFWNMHQRFGRVETLYEAVNSYEHLVQKFPENSLADDALYNTGVIYQEDLGNSDKATKVFQELLSRYPKREMAVQARSYLNKIKSGVVASRKNKLTPPPPTTPIKEETRSVQKDSSELDRSRLTVSTGTKQIESIRYWSNPDYTRVTIYLNSLADYEHHMLKKDPKLKTPYRLYVDLKETKITSKISNSIKIRNGVLQQVRSGQFKPDVARVVLDMGSVHDYEISPRNDPPRIVIDVQGTVPQEMVPAVAESIGSPPVKVPDIQEKASDALSTPTEDVDSKVAKSSSDPKTDQPKESNPITVPSVKRPEKSSTGYVVDLKKTPKKTIIIDPGHGGEDPGAKGPRGTHEKDVVLAIALKLKELLLNRDDMRVVMTRTSDVFIPLPKRSEIANEERGDLFVSIHANASPKRRASGVSTYIFDNARDEYSKQLESRENASILRGDKKEPDFLNLMFKSMTKNFFTNQSVELAASVQKQMVGNLRSRYKNVRDLGVRQARFYVLWNTEMPSVLVETSFISNREEEKRLSSELYQIQLAQAIAKGVDDFFDNRVAQNNKP